MRRVAHVAIVVSITACSFSLGPDGSGGGGCGSDDSTTEAGPVSCSSAADCPSGRVCCTTTLSPVAEAQCAFAPCESGIQPCATSDECGFGQICTLQSPGGVALNLCMAQSASSFDASDDETSADASEEDAHNDVTSASSIDSAADQAAPDVIVTDATSDADRSVAQDADATIDAPSESGGP